MHFLALLALYAAKMVHHTHTVRTHPTAGDQQEGDKWRRQENARLLTKGVSGLLFHLSLPFWLPACQPPSQPLLTAPKDDKYLLHFFSKPLS